MIGDVVWAITLLSGLGLAAVWAYTVAERRPVGRHRATGADLGALHATDVLAQQRAATDAAQQRMAAAVRRETGR